MVGLGWCDAGEEVELVVRAEACSRMSCGQEMSHRLVEGADDDRGLEIMKAAIATVLLSIGGSDGRRIEM